MVDEDIEAMIASTLDALADRPGPRTAPRPPPHGQHIVDQYAALCRDEEVHASEPSAVVTIPISRVGEGDAGEGLLSAVLRKGRALLKK